MSIQQTAQKGTLRCSEKDVPTDDQMLVVKAKSGHSVAFGELYERHRSRIYGSVFRILRNRQDAEDAVQHSFQHAFTHLHRFREDAAFSTWVTRIAINEALIMLRRRRVTTQVSETNGYDFHPTSPIDVADDGPTPEQAFAGKESRIVVIHAIRRLRKNLRTVALLREVQGLSNAETARRLGLTLSAVKARASRARRQLRKHLEGKYIARRRAIFGRT
jgi:RNA polymerase sigma-70 factor, ECF subfamily